MKKTALYVSLMVCVAFAGTAMAAPVDYILTADTPVGFGGTLTWDSAIGLTYADGGITAFSFTNPGSTAIVFDENDSVSDLILTVDGGGAPATLMIDIDDNQIANQYLYLDQALNFSTGLGHIDATGGNNVTGAALTAVPEPATMSLLAIGGLALIRRRKRA